MAECSALMPAEADTKGGEDLYSKILMRTGAVVLALLMLCVFLCGLSGRFDVDSGCSLRYDSLDCGSRSSASLSGMSVVDCQEARFVSVGSAISFEKNDVHIGTSFRLMLCIVFMLAVLCTAFTAGKDKPHHLSVRLQI